MQWKQGQIVMRTAIIVAVALSVGSYGGATAYAQRPSKDLSSTEQAACRSDAIRLCFFSIANADALKDCLRGKKPDLSASCRKLLESRGN
jgi:hypothetical protein